VLRFLTPSRHYGTEILDGRDVDPTARERSHHDVMRSNVLFGGRRAALLALDEAFRELSGSATMLDVGSGLGDLSAEARAAAQRRGLHLTTVGIDEAPTLLRAAGPRLDARVCADALRLPFADASVDVVLCSQTLHHFADDDAVALLRELNRVGQHRVVVSDLRRSWIAALGFRVAASALQFHPITRHDGVVSVLRGFTAPELRRMIGEATDGLARAVVRHRLGYRLSASWSPCRR
jgi:ubiquinone/menaquinone biosynthesis C-methylase UbiE